MSVSMRCRLHDIWDCPTCFDELSPQKLKEKVEWMEKERAEVMELLGCHSAFILHSLRELIEDRDTTRETLKRNSAWNLTRRFADALFEKLKASEDKYQWDNGWLRDDWQDQLLIDLVKHIGKGDPRDVAAYCAFAWHHGWSLSEALQRYRMEVGKAAYLDGWTDRNAVGESSEPERFAETDWEFSQTRASLTGQTYGKGAQ